MKGNAEVLEVLGEVLTAELTAINQYFIHAKINKNKGYLKLAKYLQVESVGEMKHADAVIDRILFLDGIPDVQRYMKVMVGSTIEEMLKHDLELEFSAVERLNRGIEIATKHKDNGSRELMEKILVSEEDHIDWIEAQQTIIAEVGIANYLAQQIEGA